MTISALTNDLTIRRNAPLLNMVRYATLTHPTGETLLQYTPQTEPSKLINNLKTVSSRYLPIN